MMNLASGTARSDRGVPTSRAGAVVAILLLVTVACTGGGTTGSPSASGGSLPAGSSIPSDTPQVSSSPATITLYTSVTQSTVDAVVAGFEDAHPGATVEVFRAPTGELAARIASELRDGQIRGDILWMTDPLSIQPYAEQGLLSAWEPVEAVGIADAYRSDTFWGTRFLNMVMVKGSDVTPAPARWSDLADPAYMDAIGIPDPAFAGSAFGALAYFAQDPDFGLDFYSSLQADGAIQVQTPDEVTTGVAERRFKVGMTLDNSARAAIAKGSPVELVWPTDGAIAIYSPIAVVGASQAQSAARSFVEFVLSDPGQQAIATTGWQPIRAGTGGPPAGGPQVYPDWTDAFGHQQDLLTEYRAIFGG